MALNLLVESCELKTIWHDFKLKKENAVKQTSSMVTFIFTLRFCLLCCCFREQENVFSIFYAIKFDTQQRKEENEIKFSIGRKKRETFILRFLYSFLSCVLPTQNERFFVCSFRLCMKH